MPENQEFSFCEHETAGSASRWHIRQVGPEGKKLTGGVKNPPLCGRSWINGWDLSVVFSEHHLSHACPGCVAVYRTTTLGREAKPFKRDILPEVLAFIDFASEADPYLTSLRQGLSDAGYQEFRNHFAGLLLSFVADLRSRR